MTKFQSSLPAHFDDCDLVPMNFTPSSCPRLLPQYDRSAQRLLRYGSDMDYSMVSVADYNRAQIWFHHGLDSVKAERLLRGAGCEEGSFVISEQSGRYVLSFVHSASIHHMRIGYSVKDGEAKFRLDIDRSFSNRKLKDILIIQASSGFFFRNLHNLVEYYTKHKSFVLPTKLKRGVPRPLRVTHARTRA
uniref:SH2 domain-containing protein n=1 Tax=Angiostrongylus cantonensis TaxID=6313 RepID=A0A0K0DEK1_ANGCA